MFGRTVRPDVWPDIRAAAQSIMRPGPTLGQLLQSVVWAAAQGRETRRTGWGRKDGPGHEPCARAGTGRRQLGTWFQGRLKAASRTGNQKRQIRTGGQGKWPGTDAQTPWSEASGKRGPDGLVHVRPTSVCRGACQFLGAGLLVCTRCMLVRGASVSSSSFLALFVSFVSVFSSVFQLSRAMISPPMSRATMARMVRPHTT